MTRLGVGVGVLCVSVLTAASAVAGDDARENLPPPPPVPELPAFAERLDSHLAGLAVGEADGRRVRIEVLTAPARTVAAADRVEELGATSSVTPGIFEATVPAARLAAVANAPGVRFVRTAIAPPPTAVTGEGVAFTNADAAHARGIDGTGVKVLVMDVGFLNRAASQASGDLPAFDLQNSCANINGSDHGTNVAENVHDVAPAAELVLYCVDSYADGAAAELYAESAGVDIISRSLGDIGQARGDGSGGPGTTDAAAADAEAAGILWVNSAGNYARSHWTGNYIDTGDVDTLHEWAPGDETNTEFIASGDRKCFHLKWDRWPTTALNYDLYLYRPSDNMYPASSTTVQNGAQPPLEFLCHTNSLASQNFGIVIDRVSGSGNARLDVFATDSFDIEHRVAAGSVSDSAGAPEVFSVAAECVLTGALKGYSSQGPTIDGKVRPSIAGPAPVDTNLRPAPTACEGGGGFSGTSAAAPHVAGLAALYEDQANGLSPAGLRSKLASTALDRGTPGTDNQFGSGRAQFVPPSTGGGFVFCAGRRATIRGGAGANTLVGTPGANVIAGLGGRDRINGRGGPDVICGGTGGDVLRGGGGRDRLLGQAGRDRLIGGGGRDVLRGGPGRDRQRQ